MGKRWIIIFLAVLNLTSCKKDINAFFIHESVRTRVLESHLLSPVFNTRFADSLSLKFAVFSDIHITEKNDHLFNKLKNDIDQQGIDFFIVAGDLTDNGLPEEYENCRTDFQNLEIPWYVTIGNHDLYQTDGWESWKNYFGPSCFSVGISGLLRLIFLDTSTGTVGKEQFSWLEKALKNSQEKYKIVVTHYPLYDDLVPSIWRLPSAEERYKLLWLLHKYNVYTYIGGHLHTFQHQTLNGLHHFIVGSMYPHDLDKGEHGYLLFSLTGGNLSWEQVVFP
ncbi:MAG: metallophosphoesterase [Chlorobi bacterium]|nr:metallophosphoesterase [Chlorobiota bacterium]